MNTQVKFNNADALFSKALKLKINNYFQKDQINKTGSRRLMLKAIILLSSLALIYSILLFIQPHWIFNLILCVILGVNLAAIGFNIMHDAGHNSFSENKKLNTILSYSLNLLGGNIFLWKLKHNIAHHTYTNINGEDHDIEIKFMRIHHDQPLKRHHKYQHFYFILLYSISYLAWIFFQDYEKYFRQRLSVNSEKFHFPRNEKIIFWVSKFIHFNIFITIPIIFVGFGPTFIGLLVTSIVCGLCLATVFQLAHVVDETEFKTLDNYKVEDEWMIHQLQSTANFATKSKILTWLLGGLNYQVEHHLFPKISHIHYPKINEFVKETCVEYDIKYNEYKTFVDAFKSHLKVIKSMSV
ncbi:fatty acid desaturase family protein [Sphingobacterium sp. HJSM2_6]|uniref:fatty acid desaturase family protein n=1 Tax=Sphingobacterium sp. HJSM2_6 TaxID=3366264 RepID=UPI003BBF18CE